MELILQAIKSLFRKIELSRTHYDTRESSSIVWKKTYDPPLEEAGLEKIIDGALDLNTFVGLDVTKTHQYENLVGETVTETYSFHSDSDTVKLYDHSNDYGLPEGSYVRLEFESFEEDDEYALIYLATTEAAMSLGITDIGLYTEVYAGDISYSITIAVKSGELKKLDEKYIPDSVYNRIKAAQTTANSAQTTANSAQTTANSAQTTAYSKMDKSNPTGTGSFSLNRKSGTTVGTQSFVCGYNNTASGYYSHAEGCTTTASNYDSHAEGRNTTASGDQSHAEGYNTTASGNQSHTEGSWTKASGSFSHAEGSSTKATSSDDSASSTSTTTKGNYTHAEGYGTVAYGRCSHSEGNGTKASGNDSHAEGYGSTASSDSSHAEGSLTIASGSSSHAEGCSTEASGDSSHAEGDSTKVYSYASHAEGHGTTASGNSQHVQGKFNIDDTTGTYSHIVGNGTGDSSRSNAHTVDWNGNAWYAGDVYVGSTSGTNKDEGSKKLATEEYVSTELENYIPDPSLGITGATVGQIAKITAVDSDGKPTAWEPVDLPTENALRLVVDTTTTEDVAQIEFTEDIDGNPLKLKKFIFNLEVPAATAANGNATFGVSDYRWLGGVDTPKYSYYGAKTVPMSTSKTTWWGEICMNIENDGLFVIMYKRVNNAPYSNNTVNSDGGTYHRLDVRYAPYSSGSGIYYFHEAIDRIFYKSGSDTVLIPTGTRIRIWGVDA